MVHFLAISIFLLSIVQILGSEFWNDVDEKSNELPDPEELLTQATTSDSQQVGSSSEAPHSRNQVPNKIPTSRRRTRAKHVSFNTSEMIPFNNAVTIDPTYPKNLSETDIVKKLVKLGAFHEWSQLRTYSFHIYSRYWAKVCIIFSKLNLEGIRRVMCELSPSFGIVNKRKTHYRARIQSYDLLGCHCHGYQVSYQSPTTSTDLFLVHQSSANEFFVFEQQQKYAHERLYIKNFRGGLILPNPDDFKNPRQ